MARKRVTPTSDMEKPPGASEENRHRWVVRQSFPVARPVPPSMGEPELKEHPVLLPLERVTLRRLRFEEVPVDPPPPRLPIGVPPQMSIGASGRLVLYDRGVEVFLEVDVEPNPEHMPAKATAVYSAYFRRPDGMDDEDLVRLAGQIAPNMLMPFACRAIADASSDGLYGPINVMLNPLEIVWTSAAKVRETGSDS